MRRTCSSAAVYPLYCQTMNKQFASFSSSITFFPPFPYETKLPIRYKRKYWRAHPIKSPSPPKVTLNRFPSHGPNNLPKSASANARQTLVSQFIKPVHRLGPLASSKSFNYPQQAGQEIFRMETSVDKGSALEGSSTKQRRGKVRRNPWEEYARTWEDGAGPTSSSGSSFSLLAER